MRQVTILGATGSIGQSTLDIIQRHADFYSVYALSANTSVVAMAELCRSFTPRFAVMSDEASAAQLGELLRDLPTEVLAGPAALERVASDAEVDTVVAAIVGSVGLMPTLAAVKAGKRVLLANKESLVMAGALFMEEVHNSGALLLPVDSEHNAIFQCLPAGSVEQGIADKGVHRITLTGSGGPLRDLALERFDEVTPEQACAHPNWDMGPKISVDSATMMNKGLEMIEACWLFSVGHNDIDILLHRQSIIHSMVSYADGSVIAQMGNPDMRTPIANALAWPLDLLQVSRLDFALADESRYPCLALARKAWQKGGTSMAILNAANEIAVDSFLNRQIKFTEIAKLTRKTLENIPAVAAQTLDIILDADHCARDYARQLVAMRD